MLDIAVHAWDLARAIGADETLGSELVEISLTAADLVEASRPHGSFATPADATVPSDASEQTRLLHLVGR